MTTTELRAMAAANQAEGAHDALQAPVSIMLVADVRLYRDLLANALAGADGIELVGSEPTDVAAMAVGMFDPGVLVVDVASVSVPEGMQALAATLPEAKIVAVGVPDDEDAVVELLAAGASGYVTAEQPLSELLGAIEAAANGELRCPPRVAALLARRMAALAERGTRAARDDALTPRQREIAALITEGLSNKQIARRLSIEQATVKNHVHSILVKLAVSRRDQVATRFSA